MGLRFHFPHRYEGGMIPRYSRPEMTAIWEPENRFRIWLDIELAATEAWVKLGRVPEEALKVIREKADFKVDRIDEIEKEVKHDVIAFLTSVAEHVGPESRYLHLGLTSSDVLDTCFSLQLKQAGELLLRDLDQLLASLKKRAEEHKQTPMIGRSHGIHAEPITFGVKVATWYAEMARNRERLVKAIGSVSVGKVSGAVGVYGNVLPEVEQHVCEKLGLVPDAISTQVIARDQYADFFSSCALIASAVERIATEVRHMQRTEVLEAEEFFSKGQKGSSAMPHKRNPVLSENLTGLARLVRSYLVPALENITLWHERDISHSSVERVIGPDTTITLDFMLARMNNVIENLIVYPENMKKNLEKMGKLVFSEGVLLALVETGRTREEAYRMVQSHAMKTWEEGADFEELVRSDPKIQAAVSDERLAQVFQLDHHLSHVDIIFEKVFGR